MPFFSAKIFIWPPLYQCLPPSSTTDVLSHKTSVAKSSIMFSLSTHLYFNNLLVTLKKSRILICRYQFKTDMFNIKEKLSRTFPPILTNKGAAHFSHACLLHSYILWILYCFLTSRDQYFIKITMFHDMPVVFVSEEF